MALNVIQDLQNQALPPSLDAAFLREATRRRVEELAGAGWTDYNTHDPGITILEALAYAVTDVGLRTRLDVADLIAGGEKRPFFTAREVLPAAPVTPGDYRRLFADRLPVHDIRIQNGTWETKGVLRAVLDPEPSNKTSLPDFQETWLRGVVAEREFYIIFPGWNQLPAQWPETHIPLEVEVLKFLPPLDLDTLVYDRYFATLKFRSKGAVPWEWEQDFWIRLPKGIPKGQLDEDAENNQAQEDFNANLRNFLSNSAFFNTHRERAQKRKTLLEHAVALVRQHRNLGEDWAEVDTIRIQQIGLQVAELNLSPEADAVKVLAHICFAVNRFIAPCPSIRTLEELLKEGHTPDAIFDGPLPDNGFSAESGASPHPESEGVYTSDIVGLIMRQPEVIGVNRLALDLYVDRVKVVAGAANCLRLQDIKKYLPKFSFYDTDIHVFKRGVQVPADREAVLKHWLRLEEEYQNGFKVATTASDMPVPAGDEKLDIATFYSIQHDFPAAYGLREGEVLPTDTPPRRAQAKQLKAYLLFFEQLLANYCAQLDNLQELFSMRPEAERTYFFQPLYDVPGAKTVIKSFSEGQNTWEDFKKLNNGYTKCLDCATEDQDTFLTRRNRFIDHLLARFAEDFTDYTAWSLAQNGGMLPPDLVFDKLDFLRSLPELAAGRGAGFNYAATHPDGSPDVWDTKNVSGYEKRVAALLGIPDYRRRDLGKKFHILEHREIYGHDAATGEAHFRIRGAANQIVLSSKKKMQEKDPEKDPEKDIDTYIQKKVAEYGKKAKYYRLKPAANTFSISFEMIDDVGGVIGTRNQYFSGRGLCYAAIRDALHLFQGRLTEGMHLVEHLLLRDSGKALEPVVLPGSGQDAFILDPYPYQISIFLPGWAPRFENPEFRIVVERVLRHELPAHIFPYIYWVELNGQGEVPTEFIAFEAAWRTFLEERSDVNQGALVDAIHTLLAPDPDPDPDNPDKLLHVTPAYRYQPFDVKI